MNSISISDIQRNLHKLDGFDIVEVVDKKRHQIKGYFLDASYKEMIEKLVQKKEKNRSNLLSVVGFIDDTKPMTKEGLREERLSRYE